MRQAHASRDAIAAQLKALGEAVIAQPLSQEWLRVKIQQEEAEFMRWVEEEGLEDCFHEDYGDDCREVLARVLRMRVALRSNHQFDENGYIDSDGKYVPFTFLRGKLE